QLHALEEAAGPLGPRVAGDQRPEALVVAGLDQVHQLVHEDVVDDVLRHGAQPAGQPDAAFGRGARTPAAVLVVHPSDADRRRELRRTSTSAGSSPVVLRPVRAAGTARPTGKLSAAAELSGAEEAEPGTEAPYPPTTGCARTTTRGRVRFVRSVDIPGTPLPR